MEKRKASPRFELGFPDSESSVLTRLHHKALFCR
jgi:hypothetical protein